MEQANPYATPSSTVADVFTDEEPGSIDIFTSKGRLGRLRYFFYSMLTGIAGTAAVMLASLLFGISPVLGGIAIAVIYIAMIVWGFLLIIQRCHDLNKSGWWSLLLFVPFAIFYFYFAPGTKETNQFGGVPPVNSKGVIAGAIILPLLFIVLMGVISAVAIPAYTDFEKRAAEVNIEQAQ